MIEASLDEKAKERGFSKVVKMTAFPLGPDSVEVVADDGRPPQVLSLKDVPGYPALWVTDGDAPKGKMFVGAGAFEKMMEMGW